MAASEAQETEQIVDYYEGTLKVYKSLQINILDKQRSFIALKMKI